jgi:hypothetical protein
MILTIQLPAGVYERADQGGDEVDDAVEEEEDAEDAEYSEGGCALYSGDESGGDGPDPDVNDSSTNMIAAQQMKKA